MINDPNAESSNATPDPTQPMQNGILGEDSSYSVDKNDKNTGDVAWDYLLPHFKKGTLLYVDPALDLKTVGQAMSDDNKPQIEDWLKSGNLLQPGDLHAQHWEKSGDKFIATVVSPFVLFQPVKTP
jgi:hypothetical protein